MFDDRAHAGERLADRLAEDGINVDLVVAIPRGGLPVARPLADRFDIPLDVVVARKIGAPWNPELAIGAVASDGTTWLNETLSDDRRIDQTYIENGIESERRAAVEKLEHYRGSESSPELANECVLLVDDGIATGATAAACVKHLRNLGAAEVIVGVPVGAPDAVARLRSIADRVVSLEEPRHFRAVGQYYTSFAQVTDEEAIAYLEDRSSP